MSESATVGDETGAASTSHNPCPTWCVTAHGVHLGEEDWVHVSAPLVIGDGLLARLCMSIDPGTGAQDGPCVVIGSTEYTPAQAAALGTSLIALAATSAG